MIYLLDIEGTTTSISFVYDVLFPFARNACRRFLEAHWDHVDVREDIRQIGADAAQDAANGLAVRTFGDDPTLDEVVHSITDQMDLDRKNRGLKSLQGKIWRTGYESGEVRGHVFDDVVGALKRWHDAGIRTYIYSSGSVEAQKLLFGHSIEGDLLGLLNGHFDTAVGGKREASSYVAIARELGVNPSEICFLTDNVHEADAAVAAGMSAYVLDRPGNPDQPPHMHPVLQNFDSLP
ncbi:MAG: acireductone synthase [bacterium]